MCFTSSFGQPGEILPPENYAIIAGIQKNKWDSTEDSAQKSDVRILYFTLR